jgi:hypothetical protein
MNNSKTDLQSVSEVLLKLHNTEFHKTNIENGNSKITINKPNEKNCIVFSFDKHGEISYINTEYQLSKDMNESIEKLIDNSEPLVGNVIEPSNPETPTENSEDFLTNFRTRINKKIAHPKNEETESLKIKLKEYKESFVKLRGEIDEIQIFNAKLAYTNKLLINPKLSTDDKTRISDEFDKLDSVKEIKNLYNEILNERGILKEDDVSKESEDNENDESVTSKESKNIDVSAKSDIEEAQKQAKIKMMLMVGITIGTNPKEPELPIEKAVKKIEELLNIRPKEKTYDVDLSDLDNIIKESAIEDFENKREKQYVKTETKTPKEKKESILFYASKDYSDIIASMNVYDFFDWNPQIQSPKTPCLYFSKEELELIQTIPQKDLDWLLISKIIDAPINTENNTILINGNEFSLDKPNTLYNEISQDTKDTYLNISENPQGREDRFYDNRNPSQIPQPNSIHKGKEITIKSSEISPNGLCQLSSYLEFGTTWEESFCSSLKIIAVTPITYDNKIIFEKDANIPFYKDIRDYNKNTGIEPKIMLDPRPAGIYGNDFNSKLISDFTIVATYETKEQKPTPEQIARGAEFGLKCEDVAELIRQEAENLRNVRTDVISKTENKVFPIDTWTRPTLQRPFDPQTIGQLSEPVEQNS